MNNSTIRTSALTLGSIAVLLMVWSFVAAHMGQEILLPSPEQTMEKLKFIILSEGFWKTTGATVYRGLIGFFLSLVMGLILGLLAGFIRPVFWLLQPWMMVIRSTPVMSIIILAIIWFQTDHVPVFVAFLMIFPVIYGNVVAGIRNVNKNLLEMAHIYQVKQSRIILELFIPSILPYLLAGASTAMGITWKVIIAAEILSQPGFSIGTELMQSKIELDTAQVFAWTVVAIVISFVFETLLVLCEKKLNKWGRTV